MQLESIYRATQVVLNICVYAAEDQPKPIAIIVPAEPALKKLAEDHGIQGHGLEDLAHNKKLQAIVAKELQSVGRKAGLSGIEMIEGVVMDDEEWTPQNVSDSLLSLAFFLSSVLIFFSEHLALRNFLGHVQRTRILLS